MRKVYGRKVGRASGGAKSVVAKTAVELRRDPDTDYSDKRFNHANPTDIGEPTVLGSLASSASSPATVIDRQSSFGGNATVAFFSGDGELTAPVKASTEPNRSWEDSLTDVGEYFGM